MKPVPLRDGPRNMAFDLSSLAASFSLGGDIHIGLDVGASAVKVVALKGNNGKAPKVVGAAIAETPVGCVVDGLLSDTRSMVEIIRQALEREGISFKKRPVNIGLRGLNVVFKRLVLPFQRPEEMAQQVLLEAQQQVDSDLAEWLIDWQVIGTPDGQGQSAVMLVAAKRAAVEEFDNLVKLVGGIPNVFDCDVFAIENAHEHSRGVVAETILCLDIGKDSTKVNILQDGAPVLVRSISLGGQHLTEQIQKSLAVEMDQAEIMKVSASVSGDLMSGELAGPVKTHVDEVCEEIKRTLEFFANASSDLKIDTIDRVILSGGGSSIPALATGIGAFLSCEVAYANPFARLNMHAKAQRVIEAYPHVFNVAVGLALRHVGDKPT
ncbi:MAG: type IV pilus assembly protein PilM [Silvanigrellales bacterium]|nr:type IV pilus assembly protein PilM [Silvanigrellales bacterium]